MSTKKGKSLLIENNIFFNAKLRLQHKMQYFTHAETF